MGEGDTIVRLTRFAATSLARGKYKSPASALKIESLPLPDRLRVRELRVRSRGQVRSRGDFKPRGRNEL